MTRLKAALVTSVMTLGLLTALAHAATITGAGSTFVYPVLRKWIDAYQQENGVELIYEPIGSGGGIKQINARMIDFAASDKPLSMEELGEFDLLQFPVVIGGVVPVINVVGIKPGELKLTGPVLADIYTGKILAWNNPAIAALNPGVKLPEKKINVVTRADSSGTTYIFTHYLSKVSSTFRETIGANTSVLWPVGIGGKGNDGVASYVEHLNGAIGYVEYAYARQHKMTHAQMQNRVGRFVNPEAESFQAAAANADWARAPGFGVMLTDQPGENSWPMTGATFVLFHKRQDHAQNAREALRFFSWSYRHGDQMAARLHYVPMPDSVIRLVEERWRKEIRDASGGVIWIESRASPAHAPACPQYAAKPDCHYSVM